MLFLGGIGSGKTVGMSSLVDSIRAECRPDDVLVFFDTKGDYISAFFRDGDVSLSPSAVGVPGRELEPVRRVADSYQRPPRVCSGGGQFPHGPSDDDPNRIWVAMAADLVSALIVSYAEPASPTRIPRPKDG